LFILLISVSSAGAQQKLNYENLPNFHQVNEKLYRGAQPKEGAWTQLANLGVKTVINLRDKDDNSKQEEGQVKAAGLNYYNVPLGRLNRPEDADVEMVI